MKKNRTLFFITGLLLTFILQVLPVYSETILAQGGADDLPAIVHSSLFNNNSVVLLTSELPDFALAVNNERGLNISQIDKFIFASSDYRDMAVAVTIDKEIIAQDFRDRSSVNLENFQDDTYDIYIEADSIYLPKGVTLRTNINDKDMAPLDNTLLSENTRKFYKIGEIAAKSNTPLKLVFKAACNNAKTSAEPVRSLRVLFVRQERLIVMQEAILRRLSDPGVSACFLSKAKKGNFCYAQDTQEVEFKIFLYLKISPLRYLEFEKEQLKKIPLLKIGKIEYTLSEFDGLATLLKGSIDESMLKKNISFKRVSKDADFEILENDYFETRWVLVDSPALPKTETPSSRPDIIFKKTAPTKCLVSVKGAKAPFWLVYNEGFHSKWSLYRMNGQKLNNPLISDESSISSHRSFSSGEAPHSVEFRLNDAAYIFNKPINVTHLMVNGFANGWYIDPEKLGSGPDFDLVLFFQPQAYFYLGFIIALLTIFLSAIILLISRLLNYLKIRRNE